MMPIILLKILTVVTTNGGIFIQQVVLLNTKEAFMVLMD